MDGGAEPGAERGRELGAELRDLLRTVRVVRRIRPDDGLVPAGTAGVLAAIGESTGEGRASAVDGCHAKELAARCALDASTVSRAVATLVRLELVRREVDPTDGRAAVLTLTAAGRVTLSDTRDRYDRLLADALGGWSRHDLDVLAALLRRLNHDVVRHVVATASTTRPRPMEAAR